MNVRHRQPARSNLRRRVIRAVLPPTLAVLVATILVAAVRGPGSHDRGTPSSGKAEQGPHTVLVFSRTAGFRHDSIPAGIAAIKQIGKEQGFKVEATEDSNAFTAKNLARFSSVVFLNTTGDVLDATQQKAFEAYIQHGGGFVGVHSAADTEYDWPWYGRLVGAYFKTHPRIQEAEIVVENGKFPATAFLPRRWKRTDEWYVYRENPRPHVNVLMSLDESTYEGGGMDGNHPISWYHHVGSGRSFYTGGGHTSESYQEPEFRRHLSEAIRWANGDVPDAPVGDSTRSRTSHPEHGIEHSMYVEATAYCSRVQETDSDPFTAAWGDRLHPGMKAIAVSRDLLEKGLHHRSMVWIEVDGKRMGPYEVLDKMAKRWRDRIDIYYGTDLKGARNWGKRRVKILWRDAPPAKP